MKYRKGMCVSVLFALFMSCAGYAVKLQALKDALNFARKQLDASNPDTIIIFHNCLTTLALAQPGDEEHIETVAYILSERQKIRAVVSELFGTNSTHIVTRKK